ncbi:hypothetical protein [Bradyrhizobium genomosp. III]|uniref:hypothetical protein n=1 Tax=Bradyrhizobium genomosp. III TaxID=2683271 RepID=UPI0012F50887|nr:hypothetical protein [Bradyrhizobium sp. CCBAU 15615]
MSDQELRNENLIEVLKRNGDFSKNYGPWLGALLLWLAMRSARPRSFWLGGLVGLATVAGGLVIKYGVPTFAG